MKKQILLPHFCKWIGLVVLTVGLTLGVFHDKIESSKIFSVEFKNDNAFRRYLLSTDFAISVKNDSVELNFTYTLQILFIILGGLMMVFSREKCEDEFIANIRLRSLLIAFFINYLLVIIADLLVYGLDFLVIITYNLYTIMIIHLIVFHILLWKNSKKEIEK
jgi:hypothetical protein